MGPTYKMLYPMLQYMEMRYMESTLYEVIFDQVMIGHLY